MSGKEASVFLVECDGELRCAKVYKEANARSFRQRAEYQEGRKVRNTRRARAMEKATRFGKQESEQAWQSAEVDALYQLAEAGVRVPHPYSFTNGVLIMEMVADAEGNPAPRLGELTFTAEEALAHHRFLTRQIIRMLCAGLVHGDLSEYNILLDKDGPVIIDLPQAINAAANNSAQRILDRDIGNVRAFFGRFAPELLAINHAPEIWHLYDKGLLHPESELSGQFEVKKKEADVGSLMRDIKDARDEAMRRSGLRIVEIEPADSAPKRPPRRPNPGVPLFESPPGPALSARGARSTPPSTPQAKSQPTPQAKPQAKPQAGDPRQAASPAPARPPAAPAPRPAPPQAPSEDSPSSASDAPRKRRRRRRGRSKPPGGGPST